MNTTYWRGKRVAVTGANGFIGSHAVRVLEDAGAHVRPIISSKKSTVNKFKTKPFVSNLLNISQAVSAFRSQEIVFHFAALDGGYRYKRDHELEVLTTNMKMIQSVLDAVVITGTAKLFLMSSIEVYPLPRIGSISEFTGQTNWFYEEVPGYSWAKRFMEILAKYYQSKTLSIAIARVGNVYGDHDDPKKGRVIPSFIEQAIHGKEIIVTSPRVQKIPFIHVNDLIPRLMKLTEVYSKCDPVNIIGNESISLVDLAKMIVKKSDSLSKIKYKPGAVRKGRYTVSSAKANKILGKLPSRSIEQGIEEMLSGLKERSNK